MTALSQRRTSGREVVSFFLVSEFEQGQKVIGHETEHQVVIEAAPGAALEVIQSQFFLKLLVTLLDFPTLVSQFDHVFERGCQRQIIPVILRKFWILVGPKLGPKVYAGSANFLKTFS